MSELKVLEKIRAKNSGCSSPGLSDECISRFLSTGSEPTGSELSLAISQAEANFAELEKSFADKLALSEKELVVKLQEGIVNFYPPDSVSPYIPIAAKGPWIVTLFGAVIYDTGGYGMLGLGHNPEVVRQKMAEPFVIANVMTPSFSQHRFVNAITSQLGINRSSCPYQKFICMNSGSEANTVAARISDLHAKVMTDPGGPHAGKQIMILALKGGFHGRTDRPAQFSDSSIKKYQALASFRDRQNLLTVEPNNLEELQNVFDQAAANKQYIEAMFMEPVMGEGNPGEGVTTEFYNLARKLTRENQTLFLVDSIQAGLRAHGVLSICDYPGFKNCEPPDMESFSKALNAGQYPLSVLAFTEETAKIYKRGVYGNTMTTNPRALEVACAVLDQFDDKLRNNIVERGKEFVEKLKKLQSETGSVITKVQGTGLLVSAELDSNFPVTGTGGVEEYMRTQGVNVIHGGENSLRFTPHFWVSSEELDLIVSGVRGAIEHFKK